MAINLPIGIRVAAGLLGTAIDRLGKLPQELPALGVTLAGQVIKTSMRVRQEVAELATRGDDLLSGITGGAQEHPAWATFDEDDEDAAPGQPDRRRPDRWTPAAGPDTPATPVYPTDLHPTDLYPTEVDPPTEVVPPVDDPDAVTPDLHAADLQPAGLYPTDDHQAEVYQADPYQADLYLADVYPDGLDQADIGQPGLYPVDDHRAADDRVDVDPYPYLAVGYPPEVHGTDSTAADSKTADSAPGDSGPADSGPADSGPADGTEAGTATAEQVAAGRRAAGKATGRAPAAVPRRPATAGTPRRTTAGGPHPPGRTRSAPTKRNPNPHGEPTESSSRDSIDVPAGARPSPPKRLKRPSPPNLPSPPKLPSPAEPPASGYGADGIGPVAAETAEIPAGADGRINADHPFSISELKDRLQDLDIPAVRGLLALEEGGPHRAAYLTLLTNRLTTLQHEAR